MNLAVFIFLVYMFLFRVIRIFRAEFVESSYAPHGNSSETSVYATYGGALLYRYIGFDRFSALFISFIILPLL